jgi:hypothetical protein
MAIYCYIQFSLISNTVCNSLGKSNNPRMAPGHRSTPGKAIFYKPPHGIPASKTMRLVFIHPTGTSSGYFFLCFTATLTVRDFSYKRPVALLFWEFYRPGAPEGLRCVALIPAVSGLASIITTRLECHLSSAQLAWL